MVYLTNSHRRYGIKVFRIYRCVTNMINLEFEGIIVCTVLKACVHVLSWKGVSCPLSLHLCPQLEGCVVSSTAACMSSVERVCRVLKGCVRVLS